jgi:hypothetical protein
MTATISPPAVVTNLSRTDPAQRLRDYLWALTFYLQLPVEVLPRILFVENSNSDISQLCELAAQFPDKTVEFLQFEGLGYPSRYGRGYGEARLLDYAMDNSSIVKGLSDVDIIWKATGRLRLLNFSAMSSSAPDDFDLYCDFKNYPMAWVDMRFFAFTKSGYEAMLRGMADTVREDLPTSGVAENHLHRILGKHLPEGRIIPRFRLNPIVDGIQGNNHSYSRGWRNAIKNGIRRLSRRIAPDLWI